MDHPKDHSLFGLGLPGYILSIYRCYINIRIWHACLVRADCLQYTMHVFIFSMHNVHALNALHV